ncbi:MAG TPA: glycosyltransferase family 2 protein [Acidimicrobiia bacterium]|nr:glycosyltransferase family 2 protein [Acidimicrobiia bacterium]
MNGAALNASYVLPLRRSGGEPPHEMTAYLAWLASLVDLVVVDGSPNPVFAAHARAWRGLPLRHVVPDAAIDVLNGKVAGVLTGIPLARFDRVIVADDDVRYDEPGLRRVVALLDDADLVRPQNFFDPCPWHARWDTARTLLNRFAGGDYPGTLAVRRTVIPDGYDGDVLFENLELIRTVRARGGRVVTPLDCFVRRLPPTAPHFWSQRVRQAYDDLAQPHRLVVSLLLWPLTISCLVRRKFGSVAAAAAGAAVIAELGRRRGGGRAVFPASASAFAPLWLAERGLCSWLAVGNRLVRGGCPYGGTLIRRAASSPRRLRLLQPGVAVGVTEASGEVLDLVAGEGR